MNSAKLKLAVFIFLSCQAGQAQDEMTKYDESQVKAAVEEAGVLDICPDQTLLEVAEIDVGDCRSHLANLAPMCWHIIDPLVSDYEIAKDETRKEMAKDRFIKIAVVYSSCLRAELLRQIVRSRRESREQ